MTEKIYYTQNEKRREFTEKILSKYDEYIKQKVFIKPNQVSFEEYPTTTHPEILETVIQYLQDKGHEITCGDGQGIDVGSKKVKNTTIKKICEKYGIEFQNLYQEPMKKFKSPRGFTIKMSTVPFESDTIISLPILKRHDHMRLTGALKMVVGYFSKWERIKLHMIIVKNRWKMIAEANWFLMKKENAPNHLTIMDAVETFINSNERRHGGEKKHLGYLMASKCPVVLDIWGFELMKKVEPRYENKDISLVPYIKWAKRYHLCDSTDYDLEEIEL
ncbi:MAG: DUF362 domain-containing protein [Candidatus Lokiarchaeota archaeon]|nr:DUF362 domain-containing protein [Candidatus Lokiarchaeota archaeon]